MTHHCDQCVSRKGNVFCSLPQEGVELLDRTKVTSRYKKGQYIFYEGNNPGGIFCVNSGIVKLESSGASGNNHILRMVSSGGLLGYRSLFASEPYGASALVQEDAAVCFIPKESIENLIQKYPDVALNFLTRISKELRQAEGRFCGLTDKNASERIAEALLFLKDSFPEQVWTRKEIAEWAGTTPETVMRTLAEFEDQGLIEQSGRRILIKNKKFLFDMANLSF